MNKFQTNLFEHYFELINCFPDSNLRIPAVSCFQDEITTQQSRDLASTLQLMTTEQRAVGLAANQISPSIFRLVQPIRLFTLNLSFLPTPKDEVKVMFDPEIIEQSDFEEREESCLSLPGLTVKLSRPQTVVVKYKDEDANEYEETYNGLLAQCIVHEMEHLDGKLMIDNFKPMRRQMLIKRYKKLLKRQGYVIK